MQGLACGRQGPLAVKGRRNVGVSLNAARPGKQLGLDLIPSADPIDYKRILQVSAVTTLVYTIAFGVRPANASERVWKPRRHYRRMGERISDTWAQEAVEEEERVKEEARKQKHFMKTFMRQQEEEEFQRMKAEQEARVQRAEKILSQTATTSSELPFSVKVGSVELFPYIFWGSIAAFVLWVSRAMFQRATDRKSKGGKWVYDRSLGGKKVWVPDALSDAQSKEIVSVRSEEFDRLASVAAAARSAKPGAVGAPKEFELPKWWNPAVSSFAGADIKAAKQVEADKLLTRIEQAKNRGEDYSLEDILELRRICQEGGVSVRPKTVGARDAIYRAAVEAAVIYAHDRTGPLRIGDQDSEFPETRLLSALAGDLNMSEERAVGLIKATVAAACRARLLDAVKYLKEKNEMDALVELMHLASLVQNLPVLDEGSAEPELVASSLQGASTLEERQKMFYILGQLHMDGAALFAEILGFEAAMVVPKLFADVDAYKKQLEESQS